MKKNLLLAITLLFFSSIVAQTASADKYISNTSISGVWGLRFGDSYNKVLSSLNGRFGENEVYEDDGVVTLYNKKLSGDEYDVVTIDFLDKGFYSCEFQKIFDVDEEDDAIDFRISVKRKLSSKYGESNIGSHGEHGRSFYFVDKANNMIVSEDFRSVSRGGNERHYVILKYINATNLKKREQSLIDEL